MFDAIIFDFDGVILNSEPIHFDACNRIFKNLGFTLNYEEYLIKFVGPDKDMFPKMLDAHGFELKTEEINQLINQKIEVYSEIINTSQALQPVPYLREFLETVSRKIFKIAICSASSRKEIEITLSKLEKGSLRKYFQVIISSENVNTGKPSPEGYLTTAEQLRVMPERCVVIEDTPDGIKAAKSANMHVIALLTTHQRKELCHADLIIKDFSQLKFLEEASPNFSECNCISHSCKK